jgi:hypothetical protein
MLELRASKVGTVLEMDSDSDCGFFSVKVASFNPIEIMCFPLPVLLESLFIDVHSLRAIRRDGYI